MGKKGGAVRIKQLGPKGGIPKMPLNPMEDLMNIPPEERIQLPPPPNRNFEIVWPIQESFSMKSQNFSVIYPSYLDSTKTLAQGRRIGAHQAVKTPTVSDISQILQGLKIRHVLQPHKGYSRDAETIWDNPGRVKYDASQNPFETKRKLLQELAKTIPELPSRQRRLEEEAQQRTVEEAKEAEEKERMKLHQKQTQQKQKLPITSSATNATSKSNKKKGKKKR